MNSHQRALQVVRAVGEISFVGNVIPHSWYRHLVRPNGKPYVVAIILLAEVAYWYRPELVKDEASGRLVGIRKKFQGDKYRTSYPDLAERFGFGRDQVIDAVEYLEAFGVLTKEVRERVVVYGQLKGNVLFLEPVPAVLERICALPDEDAESDGPLPEESREGRDDAAMQPSLFGTQRQPTDDPVDGNAESDGPLPEESREGSPDTQDQGQPATDLTHGDAESTRPLPEESCDPYGRNPVRVTVGIPQGLRWESRDPHGRNPVSLKGTKIPSEIPSEIPPETPPPPGGAAAPEEGEFQTTAEAIAVLRAEGFIAIEKYRQHPAWLIQAACADTGLPLGHPQRPAFAAKRLDRYPGAWQPRTQPLLPPPSPPPLPQAPTGVWSAVLVDLQRTVPAGDFATWLEPTRLLDLDDAGAIVGCPHVFARDMVAREYLNSIAAALERELGRAVPIELVIGGDS
jgi:hypothetical protein